MSVAYAILRKWSYSRDTDQNINAKPFVDEPSISLSQWTEAYQWKTKAVVIQDVEHDLNKYCVKSGNGIEITSIDVVRKYEDMMNKQNWITFEAFRNCAFGIWCVTMPNPLTEFNWKKGSCTCPTYYKKYICKHLIGIAIRLSADT